MWFRTCANCDERLPRGERHPVFIDQDDEFELYAFCDDGCRTAWHDARADRRTR